MVDLLADLEEDVVPHPNDELANAEAEPDPTVPAEPVGETPTEAGNSNVISILDKLLDDIAPVGSISPYRRLVIYGEPGTGKTCFACGVNCPEEFAKGVLLVAIEPGALAVLNHEELKDNVTVMKFKAMAQMKALIGELKNNPPQLERYHTVVFDTITTLSERHLKSLPLNSVGNPDHLKNNDDLKEFFRLVTDIDDRNIILLSHTREDKDEATGRVLTRLGIGPKAGGALNGMVDLVGYMDRTVSEEGTDAFTLQVHPKGNVTAKTRIGGLPNTLINPKITDLIKEF
jgi:hypothetical protein